MKTLQKRQNEEIQLELQRKIAQERALQAMKTSEGTASSWQKVTGPVVVRGDYAGRR
jgi:hypothetical protein